MKRLVGKILTLLKQRYYAYRNSWRAAPVIEGPRGYDLRAILLKRLVAKNAIGSREVGLRAASDGCTGGGGYAGQIDKPQIIEFHIPQCARDTGVERADEFQALLETRAVTLSATTIAMRAVE